MRTVLAGIIIVVLALGSWLAWVRYGYLVRNDPSARLQSESHAGPGLRTVSVAEMTDFSWDYVVFFGPYTGKDQTTKALGFDWPEYDETGIQLGDFYNLIVFTESNRVTQWWKLRRCAPDIDKAFLGVLVPRADATLVLQNQNGCSILRGPADLRSSVPVNVSACDVVLGSWLRVTPTSSHTLLPKISAAKTWVPWEMFFSLPKRSNYGMNLTRGLVTARACARPAPNPLAGYPGR